MMEGKLWTKQVCLFSLVAIVSLASSQVLAETETLPVVLTVTHSRKGVVTREILVKSDVELEQPTLITTDLITADGSAFFPASLIQTERSPEKGSPWLNYLVSFDLDQLNRSGEYTGKLILKYEGGNKEIPAIVRVKDPSWSVIPVLLLGVGIGVGLSTYRNERLTQDRILIDVGRLRTQMRAAPEIANSFKRKIARRLEKVDDALESRQWDSAQEFMNQAKDAWDRWRDNQEQWLAQLSFLKTLREKLEEELDFNSTFIQILRNELDDIERNLSELESPQSLRTKLSEIQERINQYLEAINTWELLNALRPRLTNEDDQIWRPKIASLRQRLNLIVPNDTDGMKAWQQDIAKAIKATELTIAASDETQPITSASTETSKMRAREMVGDQINNHEPVPSAPSAQIQPPSPPIQGAKKRIAIWRIASYLTSLALLTWLGYQQIYGSKPTFGANYAEDYLALLAWGFGIEVSRDSVVKAMQSLGITPERA